MSWGNKLVFVFVAFAGLMGTLVYKAMNTKYELVSKDYYKDELRYQDKLDGIKQANKISEVQIKQEKKNIVITFPSELEGLPIEGEAWFYCKTNADKDKRLPLLLHHTSKYIVPADSLSRENYTVKITWKSGSTGYYSEKTINLE